MKVDLKKGDEILTGKWQNKTEEVKKVGKNELGQPTVNGKPMLKFRIKRLMPKKKVEEFHIMSFSRFLNESDSDEKIYRNTAIEWLTQFLNKGEATPFMDEKRFISFSTKEDSGGADDFGDIRIEFDSNELYKQGAIAIEYDTEFFEEYPDICAYVTGFKSEDDYYQNSDYEDAADFEERGQDDSDTLMWSTIIEDYENEAEVVIKKLKYVEGLITKVYLPKKIKKEDINLIKKFGIEIDTL